MSCEEFSLSMEMPSFAIWLGTPSRLSPRPFQTPVRSGCPSAVRGVFPEGLGGALVVRCVCENSCAPSVNGNRHETTAKRMILLSLELVTTRSSSRRGAAVSVLRRIVSPLPTDGPIVFYLWKNFQWNNEFREGRNLSQLSSAENT